MSENTELAIIAQQDQVAAVTREQAVEMAKRIIPAFPKDCNKEQALEVARIALAYRLDPFLGELIPYQGKPYLTFDGRVRIADRHAAYDGYDLEPPTEAEMKALRPADNESIWKCVVYRKDRSRPTVAYGRAGGPQDRNPISKQDAVTMAQKRAIHRALRAAFPVPIPGLEENLTPAQLKAIHAFDNDAGIGTEQRHEVLEGTFGVESSKELTTAQASSYIDGRVVDTETGEVVDAPQPEPEPPTATRSRDELMAGLAAANDPASLTALWPEVVAAGLDDDPAFFGPAYKLIAGFFEASTTVGEWNAAKDTMVAVGYEHDDELKALARLRQTAIKTLV